MLLLNGKLLADSILQSLQTELASLHLPRKPSLAVVQVGHRADSSRYVEMKARAASRVGVDSSRSVKLPELVSERELGACIGALNAHPAVDSILVQLPLPPHLDAERILRLISADKDVDGLHPENVGRLARAGEAARRNPHRLAEWSNVPCTPLGVVALLDHYNVPIAGKRAVVCGRSNLVGLPLSLMLLNRDATVTIVHSKSHDLPAITAQADILVSAMGQGEMVRGSWIKPGATVIDVGINFVDGKMVGDVLFAEAAKVAAHITPVPGGVGPLTVAMLMQNCVHNYTRRRGEASMG
jgi:5,10-methylene-tetrahydrofolate dehydrogenase/methenyl tetrahydrofolate cyclohydrolase